MLHLQLTPESIHLAVQLLSALIGTALIVWVLLMRVPPLAEWNALRHTRWLLLLTFVPPTAVTVTELCVAHHAISIQIARFSLLCTASLLGLITTYISIILLQTRRRRECRFGLQAAAVLTLSVSMMALLALTNHGVAWAATAYKALYGIGLIGYVTQLVGYFLLFQSTVRRATATAEAFYDEPMEAQMRWAKHFFYTACIVGTADLLTMTVATNQTALDIFKVLYTAYFVVMLRSILQYRQCGHRLNRAVNATAPAIEPAACCEADRQEIRDALAAWEDRKGYLDTESSVEEIAQSLGCSLTDFRSYFTQVLGTNFRSWRLSLRIREAERMLEEHPEWSVSEVAQRVGCPDRSNFHKQFERITGHKPRHKK